ncbi:E3 ubiquitin-protein ligase XIAP, partial [Ciona intestinalis]
MMLVDSFCSNLKYKTMFHNIDRVSQHAAAMDYSIKSNRIQSLENFPSAPVNPIQLAIHGFYFTGVEDCVVCFSCENSNYNVDKIYKNGTFSDCVFKNWVTYIDFKYVIFIYFIESAPMVVTTTTANLSTNANTPMESLSNEPSVSGLFHNRNVNTPTPQRPVNQNEALLIDIGNNEETTNANSVNDTNISTPSHQDVNHFVNTNPTEFTSFLEYLDLSKEVDRKRTFDYWPHQLRNVNTAALAKYGFYYLGISDMVECFCCSNVLGNWNIDDNPKNRHLERFPNCRFIQNFTRRIPRQEPNVQPQVHGVRPSSQQQVNQEVHQHPPHLPHPHNAHMRSLEQRRSSFRGFSPRHHLRATMDEIAEAGFYFLGPGDLVKCWYCGNKLKNFDVEDEPWMEHAKWFPQCEFLLQNKGHAFVANIQTTYPRNVHVVNLPSVESGPTFLPSPQQNHQTLAAQQRQLLEEGMAQDYVQQAVEIFGLVAVERVMKRLIESSGCYYQTREGLINAVLESSETTTTTTTTTNMQDTFTSRQSGQYLFSVDSDVRIPVQRTNSIQPSIPMHGADSEYE